MSIFWFSRRNLNLLAQNIGQLFSAADSDLDDIGDAVCALDAKIEEAREALFLMEGSTEGCVYVGSRLEDNLGGYVTDSSGEPIKARLRFNRA